MVPANKLALLKKKTCDECVKCNGAGCGVCAKKIGRFSMYAEANIPLTYWNLSWKEFKGDPMFKNTISEKLQDINKLYEKGESFAFIGNLGIGKTYAAAAILKIALVNGHSACYSHMTDVIREVVTENSIESYDKFMNVDFFCIDEFDARFVFPSEKSEQLFGQTIENIFRIRFQNQMPTIICSNTLDISSVLGIKFQPMLSSLFKFHMQEIFITGKDFRKLNKRE